MVASAVGRDALTSGSIAGPYCIRLKISPADREDAWGLYRTALRYGGVEVSDCYFSFANAERWLMAAESLRFQFGPEYFEVLDSADTNHD